MTDKKRRAMTVEEEADYWTDRIVALIAVERWEDAIKVLDELSVELERRKNAKKHPERNGGE
jgi:hypothetical protein